MSKVKATAHRAPCGQGTGLRIMVVPPRSMGYMPGEHSHLQHTIQRTTEKDYELIRKRPPGEPRPFFAAVVLALLGILGRTTLGTCGGVNDHVIHPLPSGVHLCWCAQRAIRHTFSMYQSSVKKRGALLEVCVGLRSYPRKRCPQSIKGRIGLVIRENAQERLYHRRPCAWGAPSRFTPARVACAPCCIRFLLGGLGEVTADGQPRVAVGWGQAGEGLHLTVVSHV